MDKATPTSPDFVHHDLCFELSRVIYEIDLVPPPWKRVPVRITSLLSCPCLKSPTFGSRLQSLLPSNKYILLSDLSYGQPRNVKMREIVDQWTQAAAKERTRRAQNPLGVTLVGLLDGCHRISQYNIRHCPLPKRWNPPKSESVL